MNNTRKPYAAPQLSIVMLEEVGTLCGGSPSNKMAGTIGGNGSQTSGEHASYGGADPGEEVSVDAKKWSDSDWDKWE